MIGVGEQTGALDAMLTKIADFYDDEVDTAVAALTSLLEPIMIVFLGVVVGGLVVAMYLPIFKLGDLDQVADGARRSAEVRRTAAFALRRGLRAALTGPPGARRRRGLPGRGGAFPYPLGALGVAVLGVVAAARSCPGPPSSATPAGFARVQLAARRGARHAPSSPPPAARGRSSPSSTCSRSSRRASCCHAPRGLRGRGLSSVLYISIVLDAHGAPVDGVPGLAAGDDGRSSARRSSCNAADLPRRRASSTASLGRPVPRHPPGARTAPEGPPDLQAFRT